LIGYAIWIAIEIITRYLTVFSICQFLIANIKIEYGFNVLKWKMGIGFWNKHISYNIYLNQNTSYYILSLHSQSGNNYWGKGGGG